MTEFTNKALEDMGYSAGEIKANRMKQNRELAGIVPQIDLNTDAGVMTAAPDIPYEAITPIKQSGASPVKMDGQDVVVDFDIPPEQNGTTPFPKYEVVLPNGDRTKKQLAVDAQASPWEEREGAQAAYEALQSMDEEEAQERILEIFEGNEDAINAVTYGIATDQEFSAVQESMKPVDTNVQITNSDIEMMPEDEPAPMQRVDAIGWEDGEPVYGDTPEYAPIGEKEYIDAMSQLATGVTGKLHEVVDGKVVEVEAEVVDLSWKEQTELAYDSSVLGKVALIERCANDPDQCAAMTAEFQAKASALGDQDWYTRLLTGAATFALDSPIYMSSCALGGGAAAAIAAPAAGAASLAATPVAGAAVEAAAFSTGCWTLSLATHGAATSVLDDILESFVDGTDLNGLDVFTGAVKEFGAQAIIGFLTAKTGAASSAIASKFPGLVKMTRGVAAPAAEIATQGVVLAETEHLWQVSQGKAQGWLVDSQALLDSVVFLGSFRLVHSSMSGLRKGVKRSLNQSETYIQRRLVNIQKKYGIPHDVIASYVKNHPDLAREVVDQLSEVPRIVDGKPVDSLPDMVRDMILSLSAHHAKATGKVETDGEVTTLTTNRLVEINGKIVRKYIVQQSGTEKGEAVNRRSEVVFEQLGNGQLKLLEVKGEVDPAKIQEIIKNDNRSILEVQEGVEGIKAEKVEEDVSDVDSAVLATRIEIDALTDSVDRLSPETGEVVRDLLLKSAESVFGKEQLVESMERLDTAAKNEIQAAIAENKAVLKEASQLQREETGFHSTKYLEFIGEIGSTSQSVERIQEPNMKAIDESPLGEGYFLAEHASDNPNLGGYGFLLHVGDSARIGETLKSKPHKTPVKVIVKISNPLKAKNGKLVHEEADLNTAESPAAISAVLLKMKTIDQSEATRVSRSETPGETLMDILRDHQIDSIFYKDGDGIAAIIVPENAKALHNIEKGNGQEGDIRNYDHLDPENGGVDLSLPDIVAIAEGVLNGKMPGVSKYLGEGVRGKATVEEKADAITLAAELGKDPNELAKTLAHEIGHIVDSSLRHEIVTGERTNIIGKLISLKGHIGDFYGKGLGEVRLTEGEVYKELYELSLQWRPFDKATADPAYLRYRSSPSELQADFMSAFMVNPRLAKKIAPKSYEGFLEFLDNNKRFKKNYEAIKEEIALHGSSNANLRRKVRQDFDDAAEVRGEQATKSRVKDWTSWALLETGMSIGRDVKIAKSLGMDLKPSANPVYKYRDWLYRNSTAELYLDTIGSRIMSPARMKGATEKEFGEYLLYQRIAKGDRMDLINSRGITPKQAARFLQELNAKHPDIKDLVDEFWELRRSTILEVLRNSDAIDPALKKIILENRYYATVNVIEHLDKQNGKGSGVTMFGQIGTLKAQENPVLATIERDLLLMAGLFKNNAKKSVIDFLKLAPKTRPGTLTIKLADVETTRTDHGVIRRPLESKDPELGLITVMKNGKVKGYYVDKFTAMAFDTNPNALVKVLQTVASVNNYFREVYTIANPGFILATNPLRDIQRLVINLPSRKRDMIPWYKDVSMFLQTLTYGIPQGIKRVSGKGSARVDKMRREKSLISVAEPWGEHEGKDPLTGLLHRYHGADSKKWNEIVTHPFDTLFRRVHDLNAIMETATKAVADRYLEQHFPEMSKEQRVDIIRAQAGSPAHIVKGGAAVAYNNLFMFSNAMIQGYRGDWEAAKQNPASWSYHAIMSGVVPKVIMAGMAQGYMFPGQSIEQTQINATIMSMVPEHIKANYIVIPLGLVYAGDDEGGKAIYKAKVLLKPVDETSRLIGGIVHKLINQMTGNATNQRDNVLSFMGGEVPSLTPAIELISNTLDYFVNNKNPVDSFTGQKIIGADKFTAEMGDAEFYNWLWKSLGGTIFLKDNPLVDLTSPKDLVKETEIPVLSGIAGRLVKEFDSRDIPFAAANEIEVIKARKRVTLEAAIVKSLTEQSLSDEEVSAMSSIKGQELKDDINRIIRKGTASAWTKQHNNADEDGKLVLKHMAARLFTSTGNMVAKQFLIGLAQKDKTTQNTNLYPGVKIMEGKQQ